MVKYVRIHPVDRTHLRRTHTVGDHSFDVQVGWYRLDDDKLVERLENTTQDPNNPDTPSVFEVVTEAEYNRRMGIETEKLVRAGVTLPPAVKPAVVVSVPKSIVAEPKRRGRPKKNKEAEPVIAEIDEQDFEDEA